MMILPVYRKKGNTAIKFCGIPFTYELFQQLRYSLPYLFNYILKLRSCEITCVPWKFNNNWHKNSMRLPFLV